MYNINMYAKMVYVVKGCERNRHANYNHGLCLKLNRTSKIGDTKAPLGLPENFQKTSRVIQVPPTRTPTELDARLRAAPA